MTTLLCIVAHPDDETMLCGGTLAALAAHGIVVHVLCITRGEGGELGDPPVCSRQGLGRVREAEMRCACRALGARLPTFLDYIDPLVGLNNALYSYTDDEKTLASKILSRIRQIKADIILTHGSQGDYGHPGHITTHRAVQLAFEQLPHGNPPSLYTFCAAIPGRQDRIFNDAEPAHLVLQLENTLWLDAKEAGALCHQTQNALFKRRKNATTVRQILRRQEALHRHYPTRGPHAPALRFLDKVNNEQHS